MSISHNANMVVYGSSELVGYLDIKAFKDRKDKCGY